MLNEFEHVSLTFCFFFFYKKKIRLLLYLTIVESDPTITVIFFKGRKTLEKSRPLNAASNGRNRKLEPPTRETYKNESAFGQREMRKIKKR